MSPRRTSPVEGPSSHTGRRRTSYLRARLREAEETLAIALHGIADAVIVTDVSGCVTRMNRVAEELTGLTFDEARHRPLEEMWSIVDEATRLPVQTPMARVLQEGVVGEHGRHALLRAKDGRIFPISASVAPIRDPLGQIHGVVLVFRDLSAERQAIAARREAEERLHNVITHAPIVLHAIDRRGIVTLVEGARQDVASPWPAESVGQSVFEFYRDRPQTVESHLRALTGQEFTEIIETNGATFETRYFPLRNADGEVVGASGVGIDVTHRRRSELMARRLNRALTTLGHCNEALVRAKDEAELLDSVCHSIVEHGGYRMCWVGFADEEPSRTVRPVAGAGFEAGYLESIVISWDDSEHGRGPTGTAIRTRQPVVARDLMAETDYEPWREHAVRRGYASSCALPVMLDERVLGALSIYASEPDAFDERELELLGRLADNVAFGLAMLRLRQEREQMQAQLMFADRMVTMGTLAAGVAHEINSPLAYLTTNLDLLERDLPGLLGARADLRPEAKPGLERFPERLRRIRDAARRIRDIVGDLKTFSRSDEQGIGRVDLCRVLDASISMAWSEIRHRARLVKNYAGIPEVTGNESRLGQVFLNLLTNAAQSIEEGRVDDNEIHVSARVDEHHRVEIQIRDTGRGIPSEQLGLVFAPFFTTKPVGVGTGLGLAICRSIVGALGGEITAESRLGEGSTFRVVLPSAPPVPEHHSAPSTPAPPQTPRGRILVIDDEPDICEAMQEALGEHEVVALTDSRVALERLLAGARFDLIFCDLMMPNLTGWELHARLVAALPEMAKRVVFVTGGAFTPQARSYLTETTAPQLEKPFDLMELLSVVNRQLRR